MGVTTAPVLGSGGCPAWIANDSKPNGSKPNGSVPPASGTVTGGPGRSLPGRSLAGQVGEEVRTGEDTDGVAPVERQHGRAVLEPRRHLVDRLACADGG